jgi:hypothetical protein
MVVLGVYMGETMLYRYRYMYRYSIVFAVDLRVPVPVQSYYLHTGIQRQLARSTSGFNHCVISPKTTRSTSTGTGTVVLSTYTASAS